MFKTGRVQRFSRDGAAQESNLPSRGLHDLTDFEEPLGTASDVRWTQGIVASPGPRSDSRRDSPVSGLRGRHRSRASVHVIVGLADRCVKRNTYLVIRNMRTEAPLLLPLFRSRGQARLLARVFLHPDDRLSLNQLARELGIDPATVQREAERLEEAGILTSERVGRARLVRPNGESPFYPELSGLVFKAFGPVPVLRERLRTLAGVEAAFIYGSWARRYAGERGEAPGDIDLLILGKTDRRKLARLCREAGEELGFEVNPTVLSQKDWESDATGFIRSIKEQPLIPLIESVDERG